MGRASVMCSATAASRMDQAVVASGYRRTPDRIRLEARPGRKLRPDMWRETCRKLGAGQAKPAASHGYLGGGRDLKPVNPMREDVPPVLIKTLDDPYARPASLNAERLAARMADLDAVLGEDYEDQDRMGDDARPMLLGAVASVVTDLAPMRTDPQTVRSRSPRTPGARSAVAGTRRALNSTDVRRQAGCESPEAPLGAACCRAISWRG